MSNRLAIALKKHLINLPGWRTDRKIVVIESDDWGMVRMASKEAYEWFLKKGYEVDMCHYNRYDSIESNEDLEFLYEVLTSVYDSRRNSAVITANNVVSNPDFEKIKDAQFKKYFYEPFTDTLKRYPERERVVNLYKEGIDKDIFHPQFHGREHLNVNRWMTSLNNGNKALMDAFQQNMFTVHESGRPNGRQEFLDAFGLGFENEWVSLQEVIKSGLDIFEDLWGYRSTSFIAPCYVWPSKIEETLATCGVKYIQGTHVQRLPGQQPQNKIEKKFHYQGEKNRSGQIYLVRNVSFEPAEFENKNPVEKALKEIKIAFKYKKPAIISSHRVNYIGSINSENRDKNLNLLAELLGRVVANFPEVEFMSSSQLGELMTEEK